MKRFIFNLGLIVSVLFCLISCNSAENNIVGEWHIVDMTFSQEYNSTEKQAIIDESKNNMKHIFNADKTYEFHYGDLVQKGTWQLLADGKQYKITFENNKTIVYDIQELTSQKMIQVETDYTTKYQTIVTLEKK